MSNEHQASRPSLKIMQGRLNDQSLPPSVQDNIRQHYDNLARLAEDLKNFGMDDEQIDDHVREIFSEYERELKANIRRISEAHQKQPIRDAG